MTRFKNFVNINKKSTAVIKRSIFPLAAREQTVGASLRAMKKKVAFEPD